MKEEIPDVVIDDAAQAAFRAVEGGGCLLREHVLKREMFRDAAEAAIRVYIKSKTSG